MSLPRRVISPPTGLCRPQPCDPLRLPTPVPDPARPSRLVPPGPSLPGHGRLSVLHSSRARPCRRKPDQPAQLSAARIRPDLSRLTLASPACPILTRLPIGEPMLARLTSAAPGRSVRRLASLQSGQAKPPPADRPSRSTPGPDRHSFSLLASPTGPSHACPSPADWPSSAVCAPRPRRLPEPRLPIPTPPRLAQASIARNSIPGPADTPIPATSRPTRPSRPWPTGLRRAAARRSSAAPGRLASPIPVIARRLSSLGPIQAWPTCQTEPCHALSGLTCRPLPCLAPARADTPAPSLPRPLPPFRLALPPLGRSRQADSSCPAQPSHARPRPDDLPSPSCPPTSACPTRQAAPCQPAPTFLAEPALDRPTAPSEPPFSARPRPFREMT